MTSRYQIIFVTLSTFFSWLCPMNDAFIFKLLHSERKRIIEHTTKPQTYHHQKTATRRLSSDLMTIREHQSHNNEDEGATVISLDDEPESLQFGRQDYWDQVYKKEANYSWYAGWQDLQPFIDELLLSNMENDDDDENKSSQKKASINILIPGVGNDATLVDMFDDGYTYLTAMDYAPEGIERCRDMLGPKRIADSEEGRKNNKGGGGGGVRLVVADARNLTTVFQNHEFDAIIEKGTLDAIFLSGGNDKEKSLKNLQLAIMELGRCLKPGGTWISIAAVVVDQIQDSFDSMTETNNWSCLVDKDDLYVTEDGYTSNNIDGNLLVWKKEK